jgi:membrane-bound lytic murein transglycosylase D
MIHSHARRLLGLALVATAACHRGTPTRGPVPATASVPPAAPPSREPARPASTEELVQVAIGVFGEAAIAADAESTEPVWDLDVRSYETHDRVAHYVGVFTGTARERFIQRLARGTRYEAMIRTKLRASGMPEDLTYLALIESGYDPHAYSRAAAVGMWQFMSSTARDVGLRVDWWMDERRDPARATDGAIRFLGYLQRQFGSFYLAAAAYNGGPGRVARGLTRFADEMEGLEGEDRFFALAEQDYLREETKNYVPQLIAAALVAKVPTRYGMQFDSLAPYAYDSVDVPPGTSLGAIAVASGAQGTELRDLNPALLRGVTPPDARVWVRLPVGLGESTRAALEQVGSAALAGWDVVTVSGSTLTPTAFAQKHGLSLKQLRWFNPTIRTTKAGRLVAGERLRVPHEDVIAMAREIPDPSIEKYGTSTTLTARGVHVVRRGETLGSIARRHGITEARLKALNGIRGTRVVAGQTLVVRGSTSTASKVPVKSAPARAAAAAPAAKPKSAAPVPAKKKASAKSGSAKASTKPVKKSGR